MSPLRQRIIAYWVTKPLQVTSFDEMMDESQLRLISDVLTVFLKLFFVLWFTPDFRLFRFLEILYVWVCTTQHKIWYGTPATIVLVDCSSRSPCPAARLRIIPNPAYQGNINKVCITQTTPSARRRRRRRRCSIVRVQSGAIVTHQFCLFIMMANCFD